PVHEPSNGRLAVYLHIWKEDWGHAHVPSDAPKGTPLGTPYRTISAGTLLWVSTSLAWLPRSNRLTPRRPCEAMTIRSQPLCSAVSMMPSAGCLSRACTVSQLTPFDFAASAACVRIWLPAAVTISSYCSTGLRLPNRAMRASSSEDHASVTVTTTTGTLSALASASPCVSALPPNSEPSVAIRMRLYMAVLHVEMDIGVRGSKSGHPNIASFVCKMRRSL